MSKIDDGGPACSRCGEVGVRKQGNQWLCAMHYRFGQMRALAVRRKLAVPSHEQLLNIFSHLIEMKCPTCERVMNWLAIDGQDTVATLQHWRSGAFGIICRSCNTRHAFMPGDTFLQLPPLHKLCPCCDQVLHHDEFRNDNTGRWKNKQSFCRKCANAKNRNWVERNREYVNAKQRENRLRRKANSN